MAVIVLNAGAMACEHYGQTQAWTYLSGISYACTAVFIIVEAIIKLVAMGRKYFNSRWNAFDFFRVATASVVGLAADVGSTTSVLRVFRLARVFRLVRKLKGLRMLFNTLVISLPGLVNIGALLFLLCFVFAVLGMNLFGKVTFGENLNEDANFTNFGNSLLHPAPDGHRRGVEQHHVRHDGHLERVLTATPAGTAPRARAAASPARPRTSSRSSCSARSSRSTCSSPWWWTTSRTTPRTWRART